jgi:hypothetical protein
MCDFANRHELFQRAVREVDPGTIGWIRRLKDLSEAFQPHKTAGRIIVYHEVLVEMKKSLRRYEMTNDASKKWREECEDRLDKFFDQYVTERAIQETKTGYWRHFFKSAIAMKALLIAGATNIAMYYLRKTF